MMVYELAMGVAPEVIGEVTFGGLRAYGLGYAADDGCVVYLAVVGFPTAVRGIWAALMDHRVLDLADRTLYRARAGYLSKTARLPSGLDHLVICHQAALPYLEAEEDFYVLNGDDTPPLERFMSRLDRATAVPLLKTWGATLWKWGIKNKLIEPLTDTRGVEAWRVSADTEAWLALIEKGIRRGALNADVA